MDRKYFLKPLENLKPWVSMFRLSRLLFHVSIYVMSSSNSAIWAVVTDTTIQGILKREVSLYHWPPVWLVWNQPYDNWQFLFLFAKQTNPNQSDRRSMVRDTSPFSIPCTISCSLGRYYRPMSSLVNTMSMVFIHCARDNQKNIVFCLI